MNKTTLLYDAAHRVPIAELEVTTEYMVIGIMFPSALQRNPAPLCPTIFLASLTILHIIYSITQHSSSTKSFNTTIKSVKIGYINTDGYKGTSQNMKLITFCKYHIQIVCLTLVITENFKKAVPEKDKNSRWKLISDWIKQDPNLI